MDHQNIDRLFREKLGQMEANPSPNAWSKVEKQIRPKKTPVVYWVAASVAIILTSWIVWPTNEASSFTPLASDVNHPIKQDLPEMVLPEIDKKDDVKTQQKRATSRPQTQFAVIEPNKTQVEIDKVPLEEVEPKTMVAEVEIEELPTIEKIEESATKPAFRAVKITYIASNQNQNTTSQKADSTGALKKFIAFAEKIDPGDMLADIKTAKDNLLNGGFKDKKDRNSL
ncbi:hypothetical protein SAMN05421640_2541 [Ekhidna lutea]|uniref:Uncharacterized protein n=1 Tax=Ekhidna lutea TaxID=447679 RepID=A0A239KBA1_EKHLU|nr:hypothetical protein [Ekhidna lutea]SNT15321.1 hypothetical protein SAMN05421640_2541 [Ekhidna lutea]